MKNEKYDAPAVIMLPVVAENGYAATQRVNELPGFDQEEW